MNKHCLALAMLPVLAACGRTGFGPVDDGFADGAADDGEVPVRPDQPRPDEPDEPPPPPPVDMEGCGNGRVEPGELCYLEMEIYPSRIDPCSIDVGDLDGDGHVDVAVPNSDFDHIESADNFASVLYGDGQGRLSSPNGFLAGGDIPVGLAIADFDVDGIDDMVVTNLESAAATVLMGMGARQFGPPLPVGMAEEPTIADAGDLDGDGFPDLAVTTRGNSALMVALGNGDGSFAPAQEYMRAMSPWDVDFVDLDGDGALDVVVTDRDYSDLEVWYGDGQGNLIPGDPLRTGDYPLGLTPTDLNGDGLTDLVVAPFSGATGLRNEGGGEFWQSPEIPAGVDPREVAVADFDSNGTPDLAILNSGSQDITFAVETDYIDFVYADTMNVGTLPSGIRAADFNGDGVPDLAVSNQLDNNVGLIISNP